jgi:arginase family enzyme
MALELLNPDGSRPLHVSFDIDALDPIEAPATGTKGLQFKSCLHEHVFLSSPQE